MRQRKTFLRFPAPNESIQRREGCSRYNDLEEEAPNDDAGSARAIQSPVRKTQLKEESFLTTKLSPKKDLLSSICESNLGLSQSVDSKAVRKHFSLRTRGQGAHIWDRKFLRVLGHDAIPPYYHLTEAKKMCCQLRMSS